MSRGERNALRILARGGQLAIGNGGVLLLVWGRHVRGIRWSTYLLLARLLLVQAGRITDAGRLVLAMEGGR